MVDEVSVCNRALQMAAARSTISSLTDGSNEANQCALLFESVRDQILTMAWWNFARQTDNLIMVKAAQGTPEAYINNSTQWVQAFPAPPWYYAYQYPPDCMSFRYITGQPSTNVSGVPIFSTPSYTFSPNITSSPMRFLKATALINPIKSIQGIVGTNPARITSAAHGLTTGNLVWITSVGGMVEFNTLGRSYPATVIDANTFSIPVDATGFSAYGYLNSYGNNGAALALNNAIHSNVLLTNISQAIGTWTMQVTDLTLWDDLAIQALVTALAGFLAIPLSGDKNLANMLIQQANRHIIDARVTDGNEGYTTQDSIPDWIRIRDSLPNYFYNDSGYLYTPYPPLFAVS